MFYNINDYSIFKLLLFLYYFSPFAYISKNLTCTKIQNIKLDFGNDVTLYETHETYET